jgi:hypothetical protein
MIGSAQRPAVPALPCAISNATDRTETCNAPRARPSMAVSVLRPPIFYLMLWADAEDGRRWVLIPAAVPVRYGDSPFIPRSLLFRTIRASWSDNDCLVMAGRQAVDISSRFPARIPFKNGQPKALERPIVARRRRAGRWSAPCRQWRGSGTAQLGTREALSILAVAAFELPDVLKSHQS